MEMKKITEQACQLYWLLCVPHDSEFTLVDGRRIRVISPGILNRDAGPDFFNARADIDGLRWAGNIEIHVKASDWYRHGHDSDESYDNVILHVVARNDACVHHFDSTEVPQLQLALPADFLISYFELVNEESMFKCRNKLSTLDKVYKSEWIDAMAMARLEKKSQRILKILDDCNGDWQQACFVTIARSLGFGLNNEPFELLAKSVPLRVLHHHSDNMFQLEAILFGQAGLLDSSQLIFDEYYQSMCREYLFLARKYSLSPPRGCLWKFARTRPANFPHRRIALLAAYCFGGFSMVSDITEGDDTPESLQRIFKRTVSPFWQRHYSFARETESVVNVISSATISLLGINVVAPMLSAIGIHQSQQEYLQRAMDLLTSLDAEDNRIVRSWASMGIKSESALDSQGLLHLKTEYCDYHKCASCRWGVKLFLKSDK
jgi:hypothetical protein